MPRQLGHGANTSISCIANIRSRKVISAVIPPKRAVRSGIEEVDVLGTFVVEVVVHVREAVEVRVFDNSHRTRSEVVGRGSHNLGGGGGTRFRRRSSHR